VIELVLHRPQAGLDVAKTLAKGQLGKRQTKKLVEARKATEFVIAAVALGALVELVRREVIDQLGKDCAAGKQHRCPQGAEAGRQAAKTASGSSCRKRPESHLRY
jgi:hypothetical protein